MLSGQLVWLLLVSLSDARPAPKYFDDNDKAKYVTCGFDVWGAADSLGFAGLAINSATDCNSTDEAGKTSCAASVAGVMGALSDVASFLSSSASDCAKKLNNPAYCAADVAGLTSALANIASSSAGMHSACVLGLKGDKAADAISVDGRRLVEEGVQHGRLRAGHSLEKLPADPAVPLRQTEQQAGKEEALSSARQAEIAECTFDVTFAAQLLGRAGLGINAAVKDCTDFQFKINGAAGQKVCAVDVSGVIGSFVSVGQFLSAAASKCPNSTNVAADCSSSIWNVVAAIDSIAAVGASFPLTCGGEGEELKYEEFVNMIPT